MLNLFAAAASLERVHARTDLDRAMPAFQFRLRAIRTRAERGSPWS